VFCPAHGRTGDGSLHRCPTHLSLKQLIYVRNGLSSNQIKKCSLRRTLMSNPTFIDLPTGKTPAFYLLTNQLRFAGAE
jgi:hypothetical protein